MHSKGQTVHSPGQRIGGIYGNLKKKFMGICGSLMDIFDYPQARSANKINIVLLNF